MFLRKQLLLAGIFAGTSVIILALAAHYLQKIIPEAQVNSIKTAANIQLIHSIAIFALSNLSSTFKISGLKKVINIMIAGMILFSGSIYLLCLNTILKINWLKVFGPITPIGGVLIIVSWSLITIMIFKSKNINE